jgi:hypothetical protein
MLPNAITALAAILTLLFSRQGAIGIGAAIGQTLSFAIIDSLVV